MLPDVNLLQDIIPLYNNLARYKEHEGRLSASLQVFPSPQIVWEFEVLGEEVKQKGSLNTGFPMSPLTGYQFEIEKPVPTMDIHDIETPKEGLSGQALQAVLGDRNFKGHTFRFYLPNTRFQEINIFGQQQIDQIHRVGEEELGTEISGRLLESQLDNTWHVSLRTNKDALDWLREQQPNIGSRITAVGILHSAMGKDVKFTDYPTLSLDVAQEYIETLSVLLSFLNGGYTGPLYIEGHYYHSSNSESISEPGALVIIPRITPIDLLGTSWCTYDSDLSAYLACFQTIKRMLSQSPWDESFGLILSWYFQAIQPEIMRGGKMWQVVANALGTALERLSYTILVLEEENPTQRENVELLFSTNRGKANKVWELKNISPSIKRLQMLLERIGISLDRGFWDVNEVKNFVDVRNEATHPKKGIVDYRHIAHLLQQATQWVYEVILWRLGYNGNYLIKTTLGQHSIPHRYDLGTRNTDW